ncbi:hypothetical protein BO70DRAFT_92444 [Aspergillus heteromorphus CBS 117.55]|uniref:Galactose oxidase n=1 Tax=Aspergillus heteromorphus CBS 117.55 TaxID=1448321 RepID=A0A317VSE7_9EURO|nr:uncharacterized protein BO70DRAFT_92444 [Aspergillus heteromorphus CBS 117.55]PWY76231.1 hypothetical protein BO70DRAFT_92444 [Aspergillus heteromorphus CBS 117.55]
MDECPLPRIHRMRRAGGVYVASTLLLLLLWVGPAFTTVPYTPSQLLYSSISNGSFAYLLQTTGTSQDATTEFISWNISGTIYTTSPSYNILMDPLPFQLGEKSPAFVSAIDQQGVIKIFTGDCQKPLDKGELWRFTPDTNSSIGDGTWGKFAIAESNSTVHKVDGPNYLSAGFTFSATNTSDSSLYTFGGMCPFSNSLETTWIATANYSQSMIVLEPSGPRRSGAYDASTTGGRAPPIAEAGFTTTPLQATYAYSSTGEMRQQQDFLLVGGQTRDAFINMSQLAVFSLPQNSWSFMTVDTAPASYKTELAVRGVTTIEPRSGHTAVLSPDGSKVIVYGGWVGNTTVAARPQLVVLELGESYGGTGDWTWSVPSAENTGILQGYGIYGHGATMLPGGVMMVAGGYSIPRSSSSSSKRSVVDTQPNSQVYLYNITSEKWVSSYHNPYSIANQEGTTSGHGSSGTWRTEVGVGLGVGIPVVAGLAVLLFFIWRRRQKRRKRDPELRNLAIGAERSHFWGQEEPFMASSIRRPSMQETEVNSDHPWSGNQESEKSSTRREKGGSAAERTGLLGGDNASSPTRTARPGVGTRMYRPSSQYSDYRKSEYRKSDATGDIHPIDEREEDEANDAASIRPETSEHFRDSSKYLPPINTTVGGDLMASVVGIDRDIPSSPDKDERTSSNLSDSSTSVKSVQRSHLANLNINLNYPPSQFPQRTTSVSVHPRDLTVIRARPHSLILPGEKRYSSDSYSTAQTSLSQRRAEIDYLLRDINNNHEPSSPLDLFPKPPKPRASEWLGNNVRRVISLTRRRPPTDSDSTTTASITSGIDRRPVPRRSVSASAEVFRRKQGAKDWSVGNRLSANLDDQTTLHSSRDGFPALHSFLDLDPDSDEDWDVEGAAEGRRVQVAFTVPKEKLRVVNPTEGDLDDDSDVEVTRSNSRASK